MHATAVSVLFLSLAGQMGGDYGDYSDSSTSSDLGPRMSVTAGARTRTRVTGGTSNPLTGSYPPARVATQPRYGSETVDSSLPPVGSSARLAQEDPAAGLADKLLRDAITPARGDQTVQPLQLVQALERTQGSQQQFAAIKAYWDWSLAVSELQGVAEEDALLARLNAPRTAADQAQHVAQRKASRSRLEDSQLDVAAKVVDLLDATGLRSSLTSTIRPADVPFVGTYNTNFSRLFPNNAAPATLRKIHQTLPYAKKVVWSRADSYEASRSAMYAARDAYQGGQCSYDDLMSAMGLTRAQRRAFFDAVHDYNFAIAEYALSVAGPGLERQTVVSMLIRSSGGRPYRGASLDYSNGVLPVSGSEDYGTGSYNTYLVTPASLPPSLGAAPVDLGDQPVRRITTATVLR